MAAGDLLTGGGVDLRDFFLPASSWNIGMQVKSFTDSFALRNFASIFALLLPSLNNSNRTIFRIIV